MMISRCFLKQMLNYTSLLRSKLNSPDCDWVTSEHPTFSTACQSQSKQHSRPSKHSNKPQPQPTPAKSKSKVDLVSTYMNVMQLSAHNENRHLKNPRRIQKSQGALKRLNRLQTIQERLRSEQDKQIQLQGQILKTQEYNSCKTSREIGERQSTAVSLKKGAQTLNLNSIGVTPFTTTLNRVKLSQIGNKKIQLDVRKVISSKSKSKLKSPRGKGSIQRYFSK